MCNMNKSTYTKEEVLDVIGSYLRQISRSGKDFPTVVLSDLQASMKHVLKVNGYNGRYKDEIEE